jgi:hypothetical protein
VRPISRVGSASVRQHVSPSSKASAISRRTKPPTTCSRRHGRGPVFLVETAHAYRFYFGVYVRCLGRFTPIYMAVIDPFRKLVVNRSLSRYSPRELESNLEGPTRKS